MFPERLMKLPAVLLFIFAGCMAQDRALGPKDGHDLPATDLDRVKTGDMAPDFTLEAHDGSKVTLSDFRSKKNVILVFYRGHW